MVLTLLLAISAFFLQPGIVGYLLGALAIVPAALFLLGTSISGLPRRQPAEALARLRRISRPSMPMAVRSVSRIYAGRQYC